MPPRRAQTPTWREVWSALRTASRAEIKQLLGGLLGFALLVAVLVAAGHQHTSAPASSTNEAAQQACFVTGTGNKLCGADAVAYCGIHMDGYVYGEWDNGGEGDPQDMQSIESCLGAGYQPTTGQEQQARQAFQSNESQDPLPQPSSQ